jgi:hypothetical protein
LRENNTHRKILLCSREASILSDAAQGRDDPIADAAPQAA